MIHAYNSKLHLEHYHKYELLNTNEKKLYTRSWHYNGFMISPIGAPYMESKKFVEFWEKGAFSKDDIYEYLTWSDAAHFDLLEMVISPTPPILNLDSFELDFMGMTFEKIYNFILKHDIRFYERIYLRPKNPREKYYAEKLIEKGYVIEPHKLVKFNYTAKSMLAIIEYGQTYKN